MKCCEVDPADLTSGGATIGQTLVWNGSAWVPAAVSGGGGSPAGSGTELQYRDGSSFGAMAGTAWDNTNRSLAITGATVTTSNPLFDLSQTWNAGAVTFTGLKLNVTNTASAAGSLLADLQVGGAAKLSVRKDGLVLPALGIGNSANSYIDTATSTITYKWFGSTVLSFAGNSCFDLIGLALRRGFGLDQYRNTITIIASAATIAPAMPLVKITGTAAIDTITVSGTISSTGHKFNCIPKDAFTWTTAGNIAVAGTAQVGRLLTFVYDVVDTKWYPSYT